jgi:hypothetical protein
MAVSRNTDLIELHNMYIMMRFGKLLHAAWFCVSILAGLAG